MADDIDNVTDRGEEVNLTDWANEPRVYQLKNDLQEALNSHKLHVAKVDEWLKHLRGEVDFKVVEGRSKVVPKLIRKQGEWRYPALEEPFLSSRDIFKVNPVTAQDVDSARQNELILNKQFRVDIPRVSFINKYVRTASNHGTVIVKVAWEEEVRTFNEEQMQPVYAQSIEEFMQFAQYLMETQQIDQMQLQQLLSSGGWTQVQIDEQPVTVQVTKPFINRPVIEVKDSRNVVIDPSCEGDVDKAQFIIDRFLVDMSTLKKDNRYQNLDKIVDRDYETTGMYENYETNSEYRADQNFRFQDRARKKMVANEYWGYWDIDGSGIVKPIVATWIGDVMIRLQENPYPDQKLPFVVVPYLPPDSNIVHGDSDASLLIDNQKTIGAVTRAMIDLIARSANAQTGVKQGVLDPVNMKNFNEGRNFVVNAINGKAEDAFFMTKIPEIPRSVFEIIQYQNNEAEALTGIKAFTQGISSQALGEMLDLETKVPLYDGTFCTVGDIRIGDELIGLNGKGTKVTKLYNIATSEQAYELTFSNGAKVVAGREHKWSIHKINTKVEDKVFETVDTSYLVNRFNSWKKPFIYIPRIERIDMNGIHPNIDPYTLGFWLGDGNSYRSTIYTMDEEVITRIKKCYEVTEEISTNKNRKSKDKAYIIRSGFNIGLNEFKLSKEVGGYKHIPEEFFHAPYDIKLDLLRGLMDSDGTIDKRNGYTTFTQSESTLVHDVIRLLKSMSIDVKVNTCIPKSNFNVNKLAYKLMFIASDNPFYLERKAKYWKKGKKETYTLVAIKPVDSPLMRCLEVDSPDHLFAITEDYILTHNSVGGIRSALDASSKRETSILRRLAEGLIQIGKKIIAMNSVWLSDEEVIRVTDEEFIAIKRDDLAGNFDLELGVSTAEVENKKASDLVFMLQTLGPTVPFGLTKILMVKLLDLMKLPEVSQALKEYEPQPDPLDQEMKLAQIDQIKAETAKGETTAIKNLADAELKDAKSNEAGAKARSINSEADKVDLDFMNDSTGLTQDRELEKIEVQEKAKALYNPKPKVTSTKSK